MKKAIIAFTAVVYPLPFIALSLFNMFFEDMANGQLFEQTGDSVLPIIWLILIIASFALAIANFIIAAVRFRKNSKSDNSRILRDIMVFKLILTPYFIINMLAWTLMIIMTALFFTWILIPLGVIHAFIAMLVTSFYAILKTANLMKRGKLSKGMGTLMIILQLTFVLDIVGIIYLAKL